MDEALERRDMKVDVRDAVRLALMEERQKDHEERITSLEAFKWWLMGGLVYTGFASSGALLLLIMGKK